MAASTVLFLPLAISLIATSAGTPDPSMLLYSCSGDNYTSPSPYATCLHLLLAQLVAATPTGQTLYFNHSVGPAEDAPLIFGLAQCRADVSAGDCATCLAHAAEAAFNKSCPGRKSASIQKVYCALHYSDDGLFRFNPPKLFRTYVSMEKATNPEAFGMGMWNMLCGLQTEASRNEHRFAAAARLIFTEPKYLKIYGMALCVMNLTPTDCYNCLEMVLQGYEACCTNMIGGGFMTISFIIAHEDHPIFNATLLLPRAHPWLQPAIGIHPGFSTIKLCLATSVLLAVFAAFLWVFLMRGRWPAILNGTQLDVGANVSKNHSLLITLTSLRVATNNFSAENKLREGRVGPIYKGVLCDGKQVVVKRVSKTSVQDLAELKNEAALVSQLQHRNVVKFLGGCSQQNEELFVYEYLPNASLDKYLFDPAQRARLDWNTRHSIITGIARGLVYLHDHSRLRIMHRDINASCILLDDEMDPKLSEFGLAKVVGFNDSQINTEKIAGTFGYMAPEYASRGAFSCKSDVFSFGMLVLEIATGRRNNSFIEMGNALNLQTYVWQHWSQGKADEVIDHTLGGVYKLEEALRFLHIGLLCVQAEPKQRPSMASVLLMLIVNTVMLPTPSLPGYFTGEIGSPYR